LFCCFFFLFLKINAMAGTCEGILAEIDEIIGFVQRLEIVAPAVGKKKKSFISF